jgi:hypothetical protein
MTNKEKLEKLLEALPGNTLREEREDLRALKKKFTALAQELSQEITALRSDLQVALQEALIETVQAVERKIPPPVKPDPRIPILERKLNNIRIPEIPEPVDLEPFNKKLVEIENKFTDIITSFQENIVEAPVQEPPDVKSDIRTLEEKMVKLRRDMLTMSSNRHGGGQANRNISVGGNSSTLSKYTDINIKPGNNVTLTYSNNDTTKNLDLTIAATGGSGITRTIETTAVSSTVGAVASIDYVVLCTAGVQITLPTAVANNNLYTVKNVGASSVLIATTGGQTIDGDTTLIMPVQYTSVDIISDSANWGLT